MSGRVMKTVILDLDGPLLDGTERHYYCYSDILKAHGFLPVSMALYWQMKRNREGRLKLLALSNADSFYDVFLNSWIHKIETKEYLALDKLQSKVINILEEWKYNGVRLLLVTMRNNSLNLKWQLDSLGLSHFFDEVVAIGNQRKGVSKASEIRPMLIDMDLNHTIWIGDTEVDISAAREIGVKVCALTCGLRNEEYLSSLSPDILESDLTSFAENRLEKFNRF